MRLLLAALLLATAIAVGSCAATSDAELSDAPGYQQAEEAADGRAAHEDEAQDSTDLQDAAGADAAAGAEGPESEAAEESADPEVKHVAFWRRRFRRSARRGGGRFARVGRSIGRRLRRIRGLARLLDGLNRETATCGGLSARLRSGLKRWAARLQRFLRRRGARNSTTAAAPETPRVVPMADEADDEFLN